MHLDVLTVAAEGSVSGLWAPCPHLQPRAAQEEAAERAGALVGMQEENLGTPRVQGRAADLRVQSKFRDEVEVRSNQQEPPRVSVNHGMAILGERLPRINSS